MESTDVVLVSVCDQNSLDAVDIVYDVRIIRNDIVDTQQVIFWEFNPSIDDDNLILVFNSVSVFPISPRPPMAKTPTSSGLRV